MNFLQNVRSVFFFIGCAAILFTYSLTMLLMLPLPLDWRLKTTSLIAKLIHSWLAITCNIKLNISGQKNLKLVKPGSVIVANHQSQWETAYLQTMFQPMSSVMKKELKLIPVFGWTLFVIKPIFINRAQRSKSLRQILREGKQRIKQGTNILIFPQGTRVPPAQLGEFNRAAAMLAVSCKTQLIPIAHNAGLFWNKSFTKNSGTIKLQIGKPIDCAIQSVDQAHETMVAWMKQQIAKQ